MNDKSKYELSIEKIRNFKKPVVLLNEIDFNKIKEYLEHEKESNQFYFNEVPIKIGNPFIVKEGNVIIFDNYYPSWTELYNTQVEFALKQYKK